MSGILTVGLDLAKHVFQAHGADASGRTVLRKTLRRDQGLSFFRRLPPSCIVAPEACGGAHFRGRGIGKPGHEMRLIPPACVKPFVRRRKSAAAEAEAICEVSSCLREPVKRSGGSFESADGSARRCAPFQ